MNTKNQKCEMANTQLNLFSCNQKVLISDCLEDDDQLGDDIKAKFEAPIICMHSAKLIHQISSFQDEVRRLTSHLNCF